MRILHISEAFGGGLRTAIVNFVAATPQHEHRIYVRLRKGHETVDIPRAAQFDHYTGGMVGFLTSASRLAAEGDFDLVHLHSSYAGLIRGLLPRATKTVYSPHCYAMETNHSGLRRASYRSLEWALARRDQVLIAVSPHEMELGRQLNPSMLAAEVRNAAPECSVTSVPNPGSSPPIIAMLGRICAQKDPEFFARICMALGRGRFRYQWIGDGDDGRDALEEAGVEITGWVPHQRSRELLAAASLYVHSAAWEGGPLATLEAAEAGCPVMVRTIPSMQSLGYYVAGESPELVAARVERFFGDNEFRESVRERTRALADENSFERLAEDLQHAYEFAYERLTPAGLRAPATRAAYV
ncbi:MAG: glycosyltransferase [Mycobacterium sp.]